MKSKKWTVFVAGVFVALAVAVGWAQNEQTENHPPNYTVINLGTLGGTFGAGEGINNLGWVGGVANLAGNTNQHAVLWLPGLKIDLGTFGGPNSVSYFAPNELGQATGEAETSVPDPLGEDFCGHGTHLKCLAFFWELGFKVPLPTLGGNNSLGSDINNSGQVVGEAETALHDSTCVAPQVLQNLPAVWDHGRVRALPTFKGDPDGYANANNDAGQVAGGSGNCSTNAAAHALLWENGKMINLGSLGGVMNNNPYDINDLGEVVGTSDLAGDSTSHAFLWRAGEMSDLGTLPGDVGSWAYGVNNRHQVVGDSCDASGDCGAFLWQNGTMTDLNTLIPANSPLYLLVALDVNDGGAIVGYAYQPSTGDYPAFLAVPVRGGGNNEAASPDAQLKLVPKVTLPDNVREQLAQRHRGRLKFAPTGPQ